MLLVLQINIYLSLLLPFYAVSQFGLSVRQSVCQSYLSLFSLFFLSLPPSVLSRLVSSRLALSICLSVCLLVCLSVCLSVPADFHELPPTLHLPYTNTLTIQHKTVHHGSYIQLYPVRTIYRST